MKDEFRMIRRFIAELGRLPPGVRIGPGDDCALLQSSGRSFLLSTDMMVEGVHFRRKWTDLESLGVKAIRTNLSDIAAMGGIPRFLVIALAAPPSIKTAEIDRLFRGMRRAAREAGAAIVGGNLSRAKGLVISVAVTGEPFHGRVHRRSGAKVGDRIYVTGTLGDAALGLAALKKGRRSGRFIRRHRIPPFRGAVARRLASLREVHSLIDLSDGLAGDLGHVLQASGVGAVVDCGRIPVSNGFDRLARRIGINPMKLKISGGEDYELLFTASARASLPEKIGGVPIAKIGKIVPRREGLRWVDDRGHPLKIKAVGFRHF